MIKTFETFNELDPYGEENWEDDDIFEKGDIVICVNDLKDPIHFLKNGNEYVVMNVHDKFLFIRDKIHSRELFYRSNRFKKKK